MLELATESFRRVRDYRKERARVLTRHGDASNRVDPVRFFPQWYRSLGKRKTALDDQRPWITFEAAQFLGRIIGKDSRVFEYGAGGSTLFFATRVRDLVSVEHDRAWLARTREAMRGSSSARWQPILAEPEVDQTANSLPPEDPDAYRSTDEKFCEMYFRDYASAIDAYDDNCFDVVLIDGRARPSCFKHAMAKVKFGGYIILDNAERSQYRYVEETARALDYEVREFWGPGPYNRYFWRTLFLRKVRKHYALDELDMKLEYYLDMDNGVFVEAGANDGISQSNSLYFESCRGWRGLLIEPIPELARRCRLNRPRARVEQVALVPSDFSGTKVTMRFANLMSLVKGGMKSTAEEDEHIAEGCSVQNISTFELDVPVSTLSAALSKHGIERIDLLSLDVEGYELGVLKGLDFSKHRPRFVLVEARYREEVHKHLAPLYDLVAELSFRDLLYRLRDGTFGTRHSRLRQDTFDSVNDFASSSPVTRDARIAQPVNRLLQTGHHNQVENAGTTVFAVIPVFNRLARTRRVIDQVRTQTFRETKIVVVDDGSTDGTGEYLAAQDDVLMLRGTGNLWWAGSTQLALERILPAATDADYVLLLNNDTTFGPDYVATLVETSRQHEGAIVGSILREVHPPHELLSVGPAFNLWGLQIWDKLEQLCEGEKNNPSEVYEADALSGRGTLYPVRALKAAGGLRPRLLPHYYADYELAARARRRGFKTLVSSGAVVFTERDFGVNRSEELWWKRRFGRGSPQNIIQKVMFFMLTGTPFQRATALIRVLLYGIIRIYAQLPDSVRRVVRGFWLMMQAPFSRQARRRLERHLPWRPKPGYGALHADVAASYLNVKRARALVVGCNTGEDCKYFIDLGAGRVDGLDVIKEVGQGFWHQRVGYLRASVELMGLQSNSYDLVFSFATMEHVSDIYSAFREMVRVARPGGILYCVASPLWNSRYGHHKGDIFEAYPWIHLRLTEREILAYCERNGIRHLSGRLSISEHVACMLNPKFFNKTPASHYIEVCNSLRNVLRVINDLALDPDEVLTPEIFAELEPKGYTRTELLAVTHTFVGTKLPNSS